MSAVAPLTVGTAAVKFASASLTTCFARSTFACAWATAASYVLASSCASTSPFFTRAPSRNGLDSTLPATWVATADTGSSTKPV